MRTVISLCDLTGNAVKPWVDAGYAAFLVDPQHGTTRTDGSVTKFAGTIVDAMPAIGELIRSGNVAFVMGWPPCTDLAVSGAGWFQRSRISTLWRKPNYKFDPWHFTAWEPKDNYTKDTWLWTNSQFIMPQKAVDSSLGAPDKTLIHHASPKKVKGQRGNERSITPMGFARAVFDANHLPALEVAA